MTLIPCPDCGRDISPAAPSCIHCGKARTLHVRAQALAVAPPTPGQYSADVGEMARQTPEEHLYFPVSVSKFIVMSLVTFGLYEVYWCYQNWVRIESRTREPMRPIWRAVFAVFWIGNLFERMRADLKRASVPVSWSPTLLAVLFFVLSISWRLPGFYWNIGFLTFAVFIPVIRSVRELNVRSGAREGLNEGYSGWTIGLIILGGLFLVLAVIGSFIGE
jgi:hypothetical protein